MRFLRRPTPALLFVLLLAAVYADPLFLRRNFGGRDLLGYNLPMESAIHDAYARGRLPVWVDEISGGRPLLANPNVGSLYPVRMLLAFLPFPFAMRLFPILHWAAAGLGVLALLTLRKASRGAAWIGAVTFVFSGVVVSYVFYTNHIPGVALFPWILWALARRWRSGGTQILALSVLFGLDFLAGEVFTIGMAIAACLLWIFVEEERPARRAHLLRLGGALGLAFLIGLPQIAATYLWAPETSRAVRGLTLAEVVTYSISPLRLVEIVFPYPFGTTWKLDPTELWATTVFHGRGLGIFATLYCGGLAFLALLSIRWRRPKRTASHKGPAAQPLAEPAGLRFAKLLLLGGLALSVPPSLLPDFLGRASSPIPLRNPEKFGLAVALALSLITGLAFESLRRPKKRRWTLWLAGAFAAAAVFTQLFPDATESLVGWITRVEPPYAVRAARVLPMCLVEAGLLWVATLIALDLLQKPGTRAFLAGLTVATLVPIAATTKIAQTIAEETLLGPTPFALFVRRADPTGAFRVLGEGSYPPASAEREVHEMTDPGELDGVRNDWQYFTQLLWKRGSVFQGDFDVGDSSRMESLRRLSFMAAGAQNSEAFFGALGLRFGVRYRDQRPFAGYRRVRGNDLLEWDEHEKAYPDIRLLESWRMTPDPQEEIRLLPAMKNGGIVIEAGPAGAGTARPGSVRVVEKSPERLRLEVSGPDPTWLFVLRGYFPYRTILLDGKKVETLPAHLAFSAVPVPAGDHRIEWTENVPGGRVSRWGPVGFAIIAAGLLVSRRRAIRGGPSAGQGAATS
ncbi:MAG TPA: hypothetical protein VKG01_05040 [Thermoanaerobaculia bacterium]|nr:hypothetical protein [Thermoanaerobaculia bacterium]